MTSTQTNSSLSTARECLRKYQLAYELQLEADGGEPEYFAVGTAWHIGMEHKASPQRFPLIRSSAPSPLWGEKLAVLAAAYDWYWASQPINIIKTEFTFEVEFGGRLLRGQIDGIVELEDGRRGLIEYKTTGDSLDGKLLDKLRLDTQVGLYALASGALDLFPGKIPEFIIYDVTKKPTINPKALTKADVARMKKSLDETERCSFFGQEFGEMLPGGIDDVLVALDERHECDRLYTARLNADIGARPEYYFARREVNRTHQDYEALLRDIEAQLEIIEARSARVDEATPDLEPGRPFFPRNPNACQLMGACHFFGLCSNNLEPVPGEIPEGFRQRKHRHPELDGKPKVQAS